MPIRLVENNIDTEENISDPQLIAQIKSVDQDTNQIDRQRHSLKNSKDLLVSLCAIQEYFTNVETTHILLHPWSCELRIIIVSTSSIICNLLCTVISPPKSILLQIPKVFGRQKSQFIFNVLGLKWRRNKTLASGLQIELRNHKLHRLIEKKTKTIETKRNLNSY